MTEEQPLQATTKVGPVDNAWLVIRRTGERIDAIDIDVTKLPPSVVVTVHDGDHTVIWRCK